MAVHRTAHGLDDYGRAATRDEPGGRRPAARSWLRQATVFGAAVRVSWDDSATWWAVKVHPARGFSPQLVGPERSGERVVRDALSDRVGERREHAVADRRAGVRSGSR